MIAGAISCFGLFQLKKYSNGGVCRYKTDLNGKVVIVTGANTGIGKETAISLAAMGASVVLACRDETRGNEALHEIQNSSGSKKVELMLLDLADLSSVKKFSSDFHNKYHSLHILLNNAGIMICPEWKTKDGFEMQFGTNHLGHFLLTNLLSDLLIKSAPSRVVNVSSSAHKRGHIDFDDLFFKKRKYSKMDAYSQSKLANVLFSKELNRRMEGKGVTSTSVHPGVIITELWRYLIDTGGWLGKPISMIVSPLLSLVTKSQWHGGQTSLYCCISPDVQPGGYYADCALTKSSKESNDEGVAKKLWDVSERLVGL